MGLVRSINKILYHLILKTPVFKCQNPNQESFTLTLIPNLISKKADSNVSNSYQLYDTLKCSTVIRYDHSPLEWLSKRSHQVDQLIAASLPSCPVVAVMPGFGLSRHWVMMRHVGSQNSFSVTSRHA